MPRFEVKYAQADGERGTRLFDVVQWSQPQAGVVQRAAQQAVPHGARVIRVQRNDSK